MWKEVARMLGEISALPTRTVPALRGLRRAWSKRYKSLPGRDVLDLVAGMRDRDGRPEARFLSAELIHYHPEARSLVNAKVLRSLGDGTASWDQVDVFACFLAGPAWREGQVSDEDVHRWARSKDRWWRRAALVSTVPLNNKTRGGGGDAARTLAVCQLLVDDRDDMVVKAMSWALRELAKRDPASAREFVERHGERLAARVLREVGNKLRTGKKNPKSKH